MIEAPPTVAERKRLHRKQRQGLQYVRILLHVTDIDALIHLKDGQRTDAHALQAAVRAWSTGPRSVRCNRLDRPTS
jgi:hypothetical protein